MLQPYSFRLCTFQACIVVIMLCAAHIVHGQTPVPHSASSVSVSGTVADAAGRPVQGATITAQERVNPSRRIGKVGAISDAVGAYNLALTSGEYTLTASFIGYGKVSRTVRVSADSAVRCDFTFAASAVLTERVIVRSVRASADAPVAQSTVQPEVLRAAFLGQDPQYLVEQLTPSIVAFSESGTNFANYGSFRMRGIDQTRINITLNGVPLNDMIDQGVFFSNIPDFGKSLTSLQVQRGVGTSSNGTASFGGSVNFESVNLRDAAPGADVQLGGGSFDLMRASAEVRTGILPNNTSFYAKYTTFSTSGYRYNTSTRASSAFVSGAYFGERDIVKITGFVGRSQNGLGYFAVPKPLIDQDPRSTINDAGDRDDFGQQFLQCEYTRALEAGLVLSSSLYYGGAGGDYFTGFRDTANVLTQINYPLRNDHIGGMVSLNYGSADNTLSATLGLHGYTFHRRNWESQMPDYTGNYYEDRTIKDEMSGFVKAAYRLGALTLFGDVQVRSVWMRFKADARSFAPMPVPALPVHTWLFLNPKVGVQYTLNDNASVYASFGRTGREPTRFDMLGSTQIVQGNVSVLLTPNTVRSEFVNDAEAGVRWRGNGINLQLNGFYMHFQDEIAPIGQFIPQGFVQLRKNVPVSYRAGVEAEAEMRLAENFSCSLHGMWMTANISEYAPENMATQDIYRNVRPVQTPSVIAGAALRYQPAETLTFELNGRYVGESFLELTNNPALILPSFFVLSSRAEWAFWNEHTLSVNFNNMLNALYFTNGGITEFGGRTVPAYFVQAPRNLVATLHLRL